MPWSADPRFLSDVAAWRLCRDEPEWTVDVGVRLLVAGFDTPEIRLLAGGEQADGAQLRAWFDAALRDLGWHMDVEFACRWLAVRAARRIVEGVVLPEVGASEIGALWRDFFAWPSGPGAQRIEVEDWSEWAYFYGVEDQIVTYDSWPDDEPPHAEDVAEACRRDLIAAARRFLERHEGVFPPPERS